MQFSTVFLAVALAAISAVEVASATKVHINKGCVLINLQAKCRDSSVYEASGGRATIHGRFDSGNKNTEAISGCIKEFSWPKNWGDVYYGADNCLYDAYGMRVNNQCCTPDEAGSKLVQNPYSAA